MMRYRVTVTFQTAARADDDAEIVVEVDAENKERACELAIQQARQNHAVGSAACWHCSTEQTPPEP